MSFIEIKNVTKTFNGVEILKNLDITVNEGTVLGILGRSGSGKSVLINMLRGMKEYKPDQGQIIYNLAICPICLRVEPPVSYTHLYLHLIKIPHFFYIIYLIPYLIIRTL